jgi:prolyl oligopeptidase
MSGVEPVEVRVKTADGTMVPLSILAPRNMSKDGSHPALVTGYGAYGIAIEPYFASGNLPWLEHGGVYAVAHVRGGGEYGEEWHDGGKKATKQNTVSDFIACAEYLIEHGYTAAQHLAGAGTSAGGIIIGNAIVTRPDLFGAAVSNVGVSDMIRFEGTMGGPANVPEFGTIRNPQDFANLYKLSAYYQVKDGVKYPAMLLTTGINDPRVPYWMVAKMAARLQATTASGKPVLLRVDYDAGHGIGSTVQQSRDRAADTDAFLLWQLGGTR